MEIRKENPELKPYIEDFLIETLENCELFVKIYGKGFVKERLQKNFKKVYTEELNSRVAGRYALGTLGEITLFAKGFDGKLLTFKEIEEDVNLKITTLHEGIHAIFNKTPEECLILGIECGSGIHKIYSGQKKELGRGINEGFTNWVCEKAGLTPKSYVKLTNIVRLLEIAIGSEKVMQFGKGDIEKNIAPLLDMSLEECIELFSKADSIYNYDDKAADYLEVKTFLSSKMKREKELEGEVPQYINDDIQELNNNDLYRRIDKDPEYKKFAEENNLDPNLDETKLEYFSKMYEQYRGKSNDLMNDIQATIISKYFMKELEEIENNGDCSIEQYKKLESISKILLSYEPPKNDILKVFDEKYKNIRKRFFGKIIEEIKETIRDGTISAEQLERYKDLFSKTDFSDTMEFDEEVSRLMLPEKSDAYYKLLQTLSHNNELPKLFDYKILELRTENGTEADLFFDTKQENHFSRYMPTHKIFEASADIEDTNNIFDVTLTELQSIKEIVNNFLRLKEEIKQKSPNAKIQIADSVIIITDDTNEPSFYMIEENEIVQATAKELIPQNRRSKEQIRFEPTESENTNIFKPTTDDVQKESATPMVNSNSNYLKSISTKLFKPFFGIVRAGISKIKGIITAFNKTEDKEIENENNKTNIGCSTGLSERIHVDVSGKYDPTHAKTSSRQESKADDLTK